MIATNGNGKHRVRRITKDSLPPLGDDRAWMVFVRSLTPEEMDQVQAILEESFYELKMEMLRSDQRYIQFQLVFVWVCFLGTLALAVVSIYLLLK